MKKVLLALIVLFLLVSSAYAIDFSVDPQVIKDKIDLSESAEFKILITNNGEDDEFKIRNMAHPYWEVYTKPFVNPISTEIEKGAAKEVELFVRPVHITNVDTYIVNIKVESKKTNEQVAIPLTIGIKSTEKLIGGYVPTVVVGIDMPTKIDPREEIGIKLSLNNQNPLDYPELKVILDSKLIKEELIETLGPKEEKTIEIKKQLDKLTPPQEDVLTITLVRDGRTIQRVTTKIGIKEYFEKLGTLKKGFLKKEKTIIAVSNNPDYEGLVKAETTFFKNLFTSTTPKAEAITEDNVKYLVWDVKLDAEKTMKIKITESYRTLFLIIVLAVIVVLLYLNLRSPLLITKHATNIKTKEGGISESNVRLNIKNRGNEQIKDLKISEIVPGIVHVEKEVSIGTLHPKKILKHEKKGTIMRWEIESLDASEERVITYKIKSRLSILGELNLPAAIAKFHYKEKGNIARSNRLSISPGK